MTDLRRSQEQASPIRALSICGAAVALGAIVTILFPAPLLHAWLAASLFWSAIPIGAAGLLMMIRLIPGAWVFELAALLESLCLLHPLAWLLLLPALVGLPLLSPSDTLEGFKAAYLAPGFVLARTVLFLALSAGLAWLLLARHGPATLIATIGLLLYVPAASLFAVDLVMARDPAFHASGFGLYVIAIQFDIALATAIILRLRSGHLTHNAGLLAALLFTGLLLWAYLAFTQYLVLWSSNQSAAIVWYHARSGTGGTALLWTLALLHGIALILLMTPLRTHTRGLFWLCAATLFGKALEFAWLIAAPLESESATIWFWTAVFMLGQGVVVAIALREGLRLRLAWRSPSSERTA